MFSTAVFVERKTCSGVGCCCAAAAQHWSRGARSILKSKNLFWTQTSDLSTPQTAHFPFPPHTVSTQTPGEEKQSCGFKCHACFVWNAAAAGIIPGDAPTVSEIPLTPSVFWRRADPGSSRSSSSPRPHAAILAPSSCRLPPLWYCKVQSSAGGCWRPL